MTETMTLLLTLSIVIWYVTDKLKNVWESLSWAKYVTMGFVAILAAAAVFTYGIDILVALAVSNQITTVGEILSVLILMSGSSAVAEILEKVQNKN